PASYDPAIPFWLVKLSRSPAVNPAPIDTEAPVRLLCAASLTLSVPSSTTAGPPPWNVAVAPATICGPITTSTVSVPVLLLLLKLSVTVKPIVRAPAPALLTKSTWSSAASHCAAVASAELSVIECVTELKAPLRMSPVEPLAAQVRKSPDSYP